MAEEDEQRSLYVKNVQLLHSEIKQVSEQINERIAERQQSEQQFAKELSRLKELKGECGQC
jgi:predicted transglutaminase-like cysteine proteinase